MRQDDNAVDPSFDGTVVSSRDARALPPVFLDWLLRGRQELFDALERGEFPRTFASHLPTVSTLGKGAFPIHSANKGVGLTPLDDQLPYFVQQIRACLARCEGLSWKETQPDRIATARLLYDQPERVDPRRLGLIEIFRGQTYRNLVKSPRATLLFTGTAPNWLSYQVNCEAEEVDRSDLRFQFILGMRALFESDRFHIQQPNYPLGFVFWVNEVIEKTPHFGRAGRRHG